MPNYFQILNQPTRPWLDPAALKESFQRLAAIQHPDAAGTGDAASFALLNTAYSTLREPASRLRHLLELESEPLPPHSPVPPALVEIFMELAGNDKKLERFLARQSSAATPIEKASFILEKNALRDAWAQIKHRVDAATAQAAERLRELDIEWKGVGPVRDAFAALLLEFGYLARWEAQLRRALLALEL